VGWWVGPGDQPWEGAWGWAVLGQVCFRTNWGTGLIHLAPSDCLSWHPGAHKACPVPTASGVLVLPVVLSCLPPCCAVGILAAHCAQHRGAKRVILIDNVDYRLQHAKVSAGRLREVQNFPTITGEVPLLLGWNCSQSLQ
jgi:hypothetical protein